MKYGKKGNKHDVVFPQYETWGLVGGKKLKNDVASEEIQRASRTLEHLDVNLEAYKNELDLEERMEFVPALPLGKLELNWIDDHSESIQVNGLTKEVPGLKIKMFIPAQDLWAWVIVDDYQGQIQTFERNISWDFEKMERQTQMWLHDRWLIEQNIDLTPIDSKDSNDYDNNVALR